MLPSSADVVGVAAYLTSLTSTVENAEVFWQIKAGELIFTDGQIPRTNLFSFAAPDHPWINSEWLAQVLLYVASSSLGPQWLLFFRGLCFATAIGLLYRLLRHKGGVVPALLLTTTAMLVALPFVQVGPSMVALPLFMLELTLLEDLDWRRGASMFLLPLLFLVWANLHGSFFLGLMLLVLHILGAIWDYRQGRGDSLWVYHLIGLLPSVLFSLWNPYYSQIYLQGVGKLWQTLTDFPLLLAYPTSGLIFSGVGLFLAVTSWLVRHTMSRRMLLPVIGLGIFVVFHRESMAEVAMLAVVAIMQNLQTLAEQVRHGPASAWGGRGSIRERLQIVGDRLKLLSAVDRRVGGWTYRLLTGVMTVGLFAIPPGDRVEVMGTSVGGLALEEVLDPGIAPREAVEYLLDAAFPHARVLITAEAAGYLVYRGYPDLRVFLDTRSHAFPAEVLHDYGRFLHMDPGWEEVLEYYQVDFIVWPPWGFQGRALVTSGGWDLLHADAYMVVLGRARGGKEEEPPPSWWELVGPVGRQAAPAAVAGPAVVAPALDAADSEGVSEIPAVPAAPAVTPPTTPGSP